MPQFEVGHPRYGGRQKGVKTKIKVDVNEELKKLGVDPIKEITSLLNSAEIPPKDRLFAWISFLKYVSAPAKTDKTDAKDVSTLDIEKLSDQELIDLVKTA
jgi:hypothetical protein